MKAKILFIIIITLLFSSCSAKDGQYYYNLGEKQISHKKFQQALTSAKKAESLFTRDDFQWSEVIVLQGEIYLWQNDEEKALVEFNRIFNDYPENDDLLLNIIATCVRTNHIKLAKDFCEKGILSRNYSTITNGMFYYYLAELEFGINNDKCRDLILRAKECFLKANTVVYDSKIYDFIIRLEEKMKEPYISIPMQNAIDIMKNETDFILLDVRRQDEYDSGHIPGAILFTNETMTLEKAENLLADKNQKIYVYCRSGRRSKEASQKLSDYGYTNIVEIGGILDYSGPKEKK